MTSGGGGGLNGANSLMLLGVVALAISILALVFSLLAFVGADSKSPAATPDREGDPSGYTQLLVDRALSYYRANGRAATIDYYNTAASADGDWYVFIYDEEFRTIAHPYRKDFIGNSVLERSDSTGYAYGPDIAAATEDGHWVSYHFPSPETGEDTLKHSWFILEGGLIFGAGWWE